jgi:hypothetical protein
MENRVRMSSVASGAAFAALIALIGLSGLTGGSAQAQTLPTAKLPKPDSAGWIKIFRGDNQADFSIYTGSGTPAAEASKAPFGGPFFIQGGDTIRTSGQPNGQLIFKQAFSHYVMEVQLRWPGNVFNTGTMEKIQWNDNGQGGGLPTCVECQGDPNQGMGQVWCLGANGARPWISFKGKTDSHGAIVDSTQSVMHFGGSGGANCIVGFQGWQKPYPDAVKAHGWVTIRTEVHGKDTTRHFVDGQKVMEYWNPRIAKTNDANAVVKTLSEGMISVQSEGGEVWYRGWRIKLLPEDPLYKDLYTTPILAASRPVRKGPERYSLGFNGSTLTILSEGHPASDLTGRKIEMLPPERLLRP